MENIWLDALEFENYGGWRKETQYLRHVGMGYLIACDLPGTPVENAKTTFTVKEDGMHRIFVRTKNWRLPESPGNFKVAVDQNELSTLCGKMPTHNWYWEIAGDAYLAAGEHTLEIVDKTGWLSRFSAVFITNDFDITPSIEIDRFMSLRAEAKGVSLKTICRKKFDMVVVGAGPGGVSAAIAAARNGLKIALISGRPTVGGNASNEGTINMDGAAVRHFGMHETGIVNDIKNTRERFNCSVQRGMEILIEKEKNITLFLNELCINAKTKNGKITSITTVNAQTLRRYSYTADFFADCSGDGWLGYYAGAAYRIGREAAWQHGEESAPQFADPCTMSGCLCDNLPNMPKMRTFQAEKTDSPVEFKTPDWAVVFTEKEMPKRIPAGYQKSAWWVENIGEIDDLWDDEFARDEMVRLGIGYFGWLKNVYAKKDEVQNYRLTGLALHLSKRENRRLIGDYILTENDYTEGKTFEDTVGYCGWSLDVHHPKGIFSGEEGPFLINKQVPMTPVPYRILYSKNIENLFMAGRCCSVSHLGLGSVRVEATICALGQVVGTAAALCKKLGCTPREIYQKEIDTLQQLLIRQGLTLPNVKANDKNDLAPHCKITATSFEKKVKTPLTYGFLADWVEINDEHFCGPHWNKRLIGAEYYNVILKNKGEKQTVTARLYTVKGEDFILKESHQITLEKDFEGQVSLPFAPLPEGNEFLVSITPERSVFWRRQAMTNYHLRHIYLKEGQKVIDGFNALSLDYHSANFNFSDGNPENTINGLIRSDLKGCNCWVSAKGEPMPQSIIFTLPEKSEISTVMLTTDVDLVYPRIAFQPPVSAVYGQDFSVCATAEDVEIHIFDGEKWQKVAEKTDNYLRQMTFDFTPVAAEKVKITVNKSSDDNFVKLYEVRIYN